MEISLHGRRPVRKPESQYITSAPIQHTHYQNQKSIIYIITLLFMRLYVEITIISSVGDLEEYIHITSVANVII